MGFQSITVNCHGAQPCPEELKLVILVGSPLAIETVRTKVVEAGWEIDKEDFTYCPNHLDKMKGVTGD